jgi:hypothetical protein
MLQPKQSQLKVLFYLLQTVGLSFFAIFLAAYWAPLISAGFQQTAGTLINEPFFHWLLSITGNFFILLILTAVVLCFVTNPKRVKA